MRVFFLILFNVVHEPTYYLRLFEGVGFFEFFRCRPELQEIATLMEVGHDHTIRRRYDHDVAILWSGIGIDDYKVTRQNAGIHKLEPVRFESEQTMLRGSVVVRKQIKLQSLFHASVEIVDRKNRIEHRYSLSNFFYIEFIICRHADALNFPLSPMLAHFFFRKFVSLSQLGEHLLRWETKAGFQLRDVALGNSHTLGDLVSGPAG